ncbi:MAG: hypothetical protein WC876_05210 [Candidatus Thermoplasmatota archaeon]|jgi:hypothetical protein
MVPATVRPVEAVAAADLSGLDFVWGLETPLAFVAAALAAVGLWKFFPLNRNRAFAIEANPGLGLLRSAILLAGLWFWFILATAADSGIVGFYTGLYVAFAYAVLLWGGLWRPILGVWVTSDVVERGNLAAALVLIGFVVGTAFAFGGALSGEDVSCQGPRAASETCMAIREFSPGETWGTGGWHVVLVFFLLAYFELRMNLTMVDRIGGGLSAQARVERDWSAGLLLAAVAVSSGLVSGRAAAGDFTGWGDALGDYWRRLWPLLAIPFLACLVGFLTTDRPQRFLVRGATSAVLVVAGLGYYFLT